MDTVVHGDLETLRRNLLTYLDPRVASPSDLVRIHALTQLVRHGTQTLLEVHLNSTLPRVDLSLGFANAPTDKLRFSRLVNRQSHCPVWRRMRGFATQWLNRNTLISTRVAVVGLEFDLQGGPHEVPAPSVFFKIFNRRSAPLGLDAAGPPKAAASPPLYSLMREILSGLEVRPARGTLSNLRRCCEVFAKCVDVIYLGVWLARESPTVRIVPMGFRQEALTAMPAALRAAGWQGPEGAYQQSWGPLVGANTVLSPALDVGECVCPSLRVELSHAGDGSTRQRREWWDDLSRRLIERGWCKPARRDALFEWIGGNRLEVSQPHSARRTRSLSRSPIVPLVVLRSINHVKLTFTPDRAQPEVKAYLIARLLPWKLDSKGPKRVRPRLLPGSR